MNDILHRPQLTLSRLMSSMYGAPSKARNANVVYVWTYVWQSWKPSLSISCTMFQRYINSEGFPVSHLVCKHFVSYQSCPNQPWMHKCQVFWTYCTVSSDLHLVNPLNPELNPICYLLALLGACHFLHVSRIRVKLLTLRQLMSYIYGASILDVSRSHTMTQHSR